MSGEQAETFLYPTVAGIPLMPVIGFILFFILMFVIVGTMEATAKKVARNTRKKSTRGTERRSAKARHEPTFSVDQGGREFSGEFGRRKSLLTKTENGFYACLKQAIGPKYTICCQVRVADLVGLPRGIEWQEKQRLINRLGSRHIDFVLCEPETMGIVAVIELDDPSHDNEKSAKDDKLKDDVMSSAGIPLLRVRAQPHYDPERICSHLRHAAGLWQL